MDVAWTPCRSARNNQGLRPAGCSCVVKITSSPGFRSSPTAWRWSASVAFRVSATSPGVTPSRLASPGTTRCAISSWRSCLPWRGSLEIASYPAATASATTPGGMPRLALFIYATPGSRMNCSLTWAQAASSRPVGRVSADRARSVAGGVPTSHPNAEKPRIPVPVAFRKRRRERAAGCGAWDGYFIGLALLRVQLLLQAERGQARLSAPVPECAILREPAYASTGPLSGGDHGALWFKRLSTLALMVALQACGGW